MITNYKILPICACLVITNLSCTARLDFPDQDQIETVAPAVATSSLNNSWTPELEAEFQERAAVVIEYHGNKGKYGNGYGENEKRSYPRAMFDFLAGNREKAIAFLQQEDPQAKAHAHTEGIDYYFSFTLKGQIRKYFYFGPYLEPAYRQRMWRGAKKWTERDPLLRPHPIYGRGNGTGKDWDISTRGLWVDGRNTDNLRAMREVAVYLMAEETGNEATRQLYQKKIQRYVWALYNIGMGEWDSETYHGHTFAAYLNLYDFAQDQEVKQLAKAALDWLSAAAAVKYYRGGWAGPVKRDYGHSNVVYGSAAPRVFWLYFGQNLLPNPEPELDSLYLITSDYRPPQAIVALARKQFEKPVELLSSKPIYENWKEGGDRQPGYWETTFFGNSYQMGSIVARFADGDVAPFKLVASNSQRGVDYFVANTKGNWVRSGKNPGDQIGQYENLLIWLRPVDEVPFFFQLPKTAQVERENGIWFIQLEQTWLAIHPLNLADYQIVEIPNEKFAQLYEEEITWKAKTKGKGYAGFALEVGEQEISSYEDFKQDILSSSQLDVRELEKGKVGLKGINGQRLTLGYNPENLLPLVWRDGTQLAESPSTSLRDQVAELHRWQDNFALYQTTGVGISPISLGWKEGILKVNAGGFSFSRVDSG